MPDDEAHLTPVTLEDPSTIEQKEDLPETIIERLHEAVKEMPVIEKTGTGKTKHKDGSETTWSYLEDRVLTPEARRVMIRNGLQPIFCPRHASKHGQYEEKTLVEWDVYLHGVGLDQSPIRMKWTSEGQDYSDKGISKAATSARKDWYRLQLMVGGGPENEDAVSTGPVDAPITPEQKRELKNLVTKAEEQGYDISILPMPDTANECDRLIEHLEKATTDEFETADQLEEDDDAE